MALSPISPQELFLQPISSDTDASQQQNPVRERPKKSIQYIVNIITRSWSWGGLYLDKLYN